jgi:antitoxin HicB
MKDKPRRTVETLAWPAMLVPDEEGRHQVRFPDFPEALTDGADAAEALAEAADCLAEAVAARIADGEDLPAPSAMSAARRSAATAARVQGGAVSAIRRDGVSKSELARRLASTKDVRRLLDEVSRRQGRAAAWPACGAPRARSPTIAARACSAARGRSTSTKPPAGSAARG